MNKQEKLILFYVGLFCLLIVLVSFFWRSDQYYSNAYAPMVEKSNRDRAIVEKNKETERRSGGYSARESQQPLPSGFRERDIEKSRGDRFSTY